MIDLIVHLTCKRPVPIDRLCERLGMSKRDLLKEIKSARREGAIVEVVDGFVGTKVRTKAGKLIVLGDATPGRHKVAMVTDIHHGSKTCDRDALLHFLHRSWDAGCRTVACCGDVLDGHRDFLILEQRAVGFDAQSDEAVNTWCKAPPFQVVAIDGNHDGYFSNAIGFVSGELLEHRMRAAGVDWHFAGVCIGRALIHGAKWMLWHPHGAASTRNALRRKLNEKAESLQEPVDILAMGHFHHYAAIPIVNEHVFGIAGATFQRMGSEFSNRATQPWDVGGQIVSYDFNKGHVTHVAAEFKAA